MICPNCKSELYFLLENNGRILKCRKCGYEGPYIKPDYSNYHDNRYKYSFVRSETNDPLINKMISVMGFSKNDRVLDYGCGAGDLSNAINKYSKNIVGIDININVAREKYTSIKFVKQKNKKIDFPDNSFDKIVAVNVIEHVPDYLFLLSEFERVLVKGGKLFITSYDKYFILHSILNDPTHVIEWSMDEFKTLIENKFEVKNYFKYGSFFNYRFINGLIVKILKPELCILARKQ